MCSFPFEGKSIIIQLKEEKEALRQLVGKLSEEKRQLERERDQLQAALLSTREQVNLCCCCAFIFAIL